MYKVSESYILSYENLQKVADFCEQLRGHFLRQITYLLRKSFVTEVTRTYEKVRFCPPESYRKLPTDAENSKKVHQKLRAHMPYITHDKVGII